MEHLYLVTSQHMTSLAASRQLVYIDDVFGGKCRRNAAKVDVSSAEGGRFNVPQFCRRNVGPVAAEIGDAYHERAGLARSSA